MQMEDTLWILWVVICLINLSICRSKHLRSFSLERKISGFLFLMACRYLLVLLYLCMAGWKVSSIFPVSQNIYQWDSFYCFFLERRGIRNWLGYRIPITVWQFRIFFPRIVSCISFFYMASCFFLCICFVLCLYLLQFSQYARALKERGIESKTIVFPEDIHGIDKLVTF